MKRELKEDTTERELGKRLHSCRICGSRGDFSSYLVREMMQGTGEEFEYFSCAKCGCLQIAMIPEDLGKYYEDAYYSFRDESFEEVLTGPAAGAEDEKILDVGCGSGSWLIGMAKKGFRRLWGCDPFIEKDLQYGDTIRIRKCSIHEIEGAGEYAVIHIGDSLEHMEDPVSAMKDAVRLLRDDGVIVIHVPIFPNIVFDMFGAHWYQLDAPRHLHIPSKMTLEYIAEQSGLSISGMEYDAGELPVLMSWFYQHGISFPEITDELIRDTFSEEYVEEIRQMIAETNRLGYGDSAGVVMRKRGTI